MALNERRESRRYYNFEDVLWMAPSFAPLRKRMAVGELRLMADLVWQAEKGCGPCPVIKCIGNKPESYYLTSTKRGVPGTIRLILKHQNAAGLLHEIAHALGPHDKLTHGPAFRRRCLRLYRTYGNWSGEVDFKETR